MKTFSSPVLAALASGNVAFAQLVHLAFSTPTVLNSSTWDLTWSSVVYKGAYGLGTISPISDKPGEVQGVTFEMAAADPSIVSLALDGSDVVQGTVATIRTAIVETSTYTVLDAPIEWLGKLDTMQLSEDASSASVRVSAESAAVDLLRGNPWYYSDSDQRLVNATDGIFSFVQDQIDKPVIWPNRSYFQQ